MQTALLSIPLPGIRNEEPHMTADQTYARQRPVLTRAFARHYGEMVLVMLVGMAVLALPAGRATSALWPGVDPADTTLMLGRMGVTMALPMVPWMRWRGHGW